GIRDFHVTGVQTCALPIYAQPRRHINNRVVFLFILCKKYFQLPSNLVPVFILSLFLGLMLRSLSFTSNIFLYFCLLHNSVTNKNFMPVKIPDNLTAIDLLKKENIFVMSDLRANAQDIRPLRVIILNLMT